MAVNYDDTLATDRDKVRFHIGDTIREDGPQPKGVNFTDGEITGVLSIETTWQRAVYSLLQTLATAWSRYADVTAGPRRESLSQVAEGYRNQAAQWAREHNIMPGIQVAGVIRVDGYSDDIASDDVDTDQEYSRVKLLWTGHST